MKSVAELFLEARSSLRSAMLLGGTTSEAVASKFKEIETGYVTQSEDLVLDRPVVAAVLKVTSRLSLTAAHAANAQAMSGAQLPLPISTPVIPALVAALAISSVLCILMGPAPLAAVLCLVLGALGILSANGTFARLAVKWPFSIFLLDRTQQRSQLEADAARRVARETTIDEHLREIEGVLRAVDQALSEARHRAELDRKSSHSGMRERTEVAFLQDLYEAAASGDGPHALAIAQRKLVPVAQGLGYEIVEASEETIGHFSLDGARGTGSLRTVRPAVLEGQTCVARGYARIEKVAP